MSHSSREPSVLVIGGGHNGLILATLLADRGYRVRVLEARTTVGGAAETIRFRCGCLVSRAANLLRLLDNSVMPLLARASTVPLQEVFHVPEFQTLVRTVAGDLSLRSTATAELSAMLAEQTGESESRICSYFTDLGSAANIVAPLWTDPLATRRLFRQKLDEAGRQYSELFLDGSIDHTAKHYFSNELVAFALCDLCNLIVRSTSERTSAFCLLYLASGNAPFAPAYALPRGGMGTIVDLLLKSALISGVEIETGAAVVELLVRQDRIDRAVLADGRIMTADIFVTGVGPATTERMIIDSGGTGSQIQASAYETGAAKFSGVVPKSVFFREFGPKKTWPGQIVLCENRTTFQECTRLASLGGASEYPLVEVNLPVPNHEGSHCSKHMPISVYSMFFPYSWCKELGPERSSKEMENRVRKVIGRWYPQVADSFVIEDLLSPLSCETIYGMFRGDVDHGSFAAGNSIDGRGYALLPHGSTRYSNLFSCSAGIHPGGLISGRPAMVCARTILGEL
jgi:phytoene dehydrogenase-like protein